MINLKKHKFFKLDASKILTIRGDNISGIRELCGKNIYNHILGFEINSTDTIMDLGANVGIFSTLAALNGNRVFSIEAQENYIPIIKENLKLNNCLSKTTVIHGLIGSKSGVLSIIKNRDQCSHWGKEPPIVSIEEILKTYNINIVDF